MPYTRVRISAEEGIGWFEFDHPPINAFDWQMLRETPEGLAELLGREDVRALVVGSALEGWFTAGAEMEVLQAMDGAAMREWIGLSQRVARVLHDADKPLIAAISGRAVGGGLEIATLCDLRIAAADARVGQPEIGIGFFPPIAATRTLGRLLGRSGALRLLYEGRVLGAEEARELGLLDFVVSPAELRAEARARAAELAAKPRQALAAIRQLVSAGESLELEEFLTLEEELAVRIAESEDFREGVAAFIGKRPPRWSS